jgi:hypothetical protein
MKCIKCIKQAKSYTVGEIRRVNDVEANERVDGGYWKFIPKSEWKADRRPAKKVVEEVIVEVQEQTIAEKQLSKKKKDK